MAGLLDPPAFAGAGLPTDRGERDLVGEELRLWAADPFEFQRNNCGLAIVAYVERVTGRVLTPAPKFDGEVGAGIMLARRGGFEGYCRWAMAALGCELTAAPERGDVALVMLPGAGLTACLATQFGQWAARGAGGVVIQPGTALVAWRVIASGQGRLPCPRP